MAQIQFKDIDYSLQEKGKAKVFKEVELFLASSIPGNHLTQSS